MQFESRWEKQQRLKRQKRSSVAGMITAVILVLLLGVAMWNGKRTLEKKNRIYEEQSESLTQQINEQQQRQKELEEYKKYVICVLKPSNNNKTWSSLLNKLQHLYKEKS